MMTTNKNWKEMVWRERLSYIKICLGRGQSWLSDLKNIAMFATFFKIWGIDLTLAFGLGVFGILAFIVIGFIDMHWGIWQTEAEMSTRKVNPYFRDLERSVKNGQDTKAT